MSQRPDETLAPVKQECSPKCPLHGFADSHIDYTPSNLPRPTVHNLRQEDQAAKIYSPIKDWQTRLIMLQPGASGTELQMDLVVVDLILYNGVVDHTQQTRITYEAISYCWSPPVFDHLVSVDGSPYTITENLYQALQHLRSQTAPRHIWVDALCINQHDLDERATQVSNMREIFMKAETVLVWLGTCSAEMSAALEFVKDEFAEDVFHIRGYVIDELCARHRVLIAKSLNELFRKPWFRRLWIRQEVWAARRVSAYCGKTQMPWSGLRNIHLSAYERVVRTWLRVITPSESQVLRSVTNLPIVASSCSCGNAPSGISLLDAIVSSVDCECWDSRDRIYSLVGMTEAREKVRSGSSSNPRTLTIDYKRSAADVLQDATRYIMLSDGNCALLCLKWGLEVKLTVIHCHRGVQIGAMEPQ